MFIVILCREAVPEPNILFGATAMKKLKTVYMVKIVRNVQLLMNLQITNTVHLIRANQEIFLLHENSVRLQDLSLAVYEKNF